MAKISTKAHAMLDYLTVAQIFGLPRLLGCSRATRQFTTAVAATKLAYTLLSRHEGGLIKLLPMKAHLAMDAVGGAALCAAPAALDEPNALVAATLVAIGLFDIAAAPMTEPCAPFDQASGFGAVHREPITGATTPSWAREPEVPSSNFSDPSATPAIAGHGPAGDPVAGHGI